MAEPEGPQAPSFPEGAQDPPAPPAPQAPQATEVPKALQQPVPQMLPLNWAHFKPKFSGKPNKDAEAHLLIANHWMDTHKF